MRRRACRTRAECVEQWGGPLTSNTVMILLWMTRLVHTSTWRRLEPGCAVPCRRADRVWMWLDCLETHSKSKSESESASSLSHSTGFRQFSFYCDTAVSCLTNDTLTTSSPDCYDYWCQASPTVRRCCSAPAASHYLRLLGDILSCILCYRLLFPVYPLVLPLDTVLSHNYHILPSFDHL